MSQKLWLGLQLRTRIDTYIQPRKGVVSSAFSSFISDGQLMNRLVSIIHPDLHPSSTLFHVPQCPIVPCTHHIGPIFYCISRASLMSSSALHVHSSPVASRRDAVLYLLLGPFGSAWHMRSPSVASCRVTAPCCVWSGALLSVPWVCARPCTRPLSRRGTVLCTVEALLAAPSVCALPSLCRLMTP
jgi:hypothetical protein